MIEKIKNYILNNKKHVAIYTVSLLLGFALVSLTSANEETVSKLIDENNSNRVVIEENKKLLEEKQIEIENVKKEIQDIKSSIKEIEERTNNL